MKTKRQLLEAKLRRIIKEELLKENVEGLKAGMRRAIKTLTVQYFKGNDPGRISNFAEHLTEDMIALLQEYDIIAENS